MPTPKAVITQAEVRRYLKAMREAGFPEARLEIAKPDGTKVSIVATRFTEATDDPDDIDVMIERLP